MKSLFEITKEYKIERPKTSLRSDLIKSFMVEINSERLENKLPFVAILRKVQHLDYKDLETFYKMCLEYRNRGKSFSKRFFGSLKSK